MQVLIVTQWWLDSPQLMVWLVWLSYRVTILVVVEKIFFWLHTSIYIYFFNINSESVKSYIIVVFYMLKLYGVWMACSTVDV